jgi:hypothetical protein
MTSEFRPTNRASQSSDINHVCPEITDVAALKPVKERLSPVVRQHPRTNTAFESVNGMFILNDEFH